MKGHPFKRSKQIPTIGAIYKIVELGNSVLKYVLLYSITCTAFASEFKKPDILGKIKGKICNCKKKAREVDIELFNQPYLKDSILSFDGNFADLNRSFSFAKIKIIFRYRF